MAINEVFPNPTVREVHFEIRFPNLLYIESKMGDFQLAIMDRFPTSREVVQRHVVFADLEDDNRSDLPRKTPESPAVSKIWKFESDTGIEVDVRSNHLGLKSTRHRTYNNRAETERFRDLVEFVLKSFRDVVRLPVISRLGLRYVDYCPLPEPLDNTSFASFYNTAFPLNRFQLSGSKGMLFRGTFVKNGHFLRYQELLEEHERGPRYILDFDAYSLQVTPDSCMSVADALHELLSEEFKASIRGPVYDYMRREERP